MVPLLTHFALALISVAQSGAPRPSPDSYQGAARVAAETLRASLGDLAESRLRESPEAVRVEHLVAGARKAAAELRAAQADSRVAGFLERVPETGSLSDLTKQLAGWADDLLFVPVREAPLPLGFPEPALLHEVEVASYPAYRLASAPMGRAGESMAFWRLFAHIQRERIAMTAPVEITWDADGREVRMAFLYERPTQGSAGSQGAVEVLDVPEATVVRLGMRGETSRRRVEEARRVLEGWIASQSEWEVSGPLRVMGYNSPSVRGNRRFFEVHLPVRPIRPDSGDGQGPPAVGAVR